MDKQKGNEGIFERTKQKPLSSSPFKDRLRYGVRRRPEHKLCKPKHKTDKESAIRWSSIFHYIAIGAQGLGIYGFMTVRRKLSDRYLMDH